MMGNAEDGVYRVLKVIFVTLVALPSVRQHLLSITRFKIILPSFQLLTASCSCIHFSCT